MSITTITRPQMSFAQARAHSLAEKWRALLTLFQNPEYYSVQAKSRQSPKADASEVEIRTTRNLRGQHDPDGELIAHVAFWFESTTVTFPAPMSYSLHRKFVRALEEVLTEFPAQKTPWISKLVKAFAKTELGSLPSQQDEFRELLEKAHDDDNPGHGNLFSHEVQGSPEGYNAKRWEQLIAANIVLAHPDAGENRFSINEDPDSWGTARPAQVEPV